MKYDYLHSPFIKAIGKWWRPYINIMFRPKILGLEHLRNADEKILIVSNHNIGALVESHYLLFAYRSVFNSKRKVFGFTHPSLFQIPLVSQYFKAIGAVPSTYEIAKRVFDEDQSLLIFPGGNAQALRGIWKYKDNHFRNSHGWARIARENKVKVLPVTYKNTHFLNPVIVSSELLSKILIIPYFLKIKVFSITLAQILLSAAVFLVLHFFNTPPTISVILAFITFILSSLAPIIPINIEIEFHPLIETERFVSQDELEDTVQNIYNNIYNKDFPARKH